MPLVFPSAQGSATHTSPASAANVSPLQKILVSLIVLAALGWTAYGATGFNWRTHTWQFDPLIQLVIALAIPAALLLIGSFWKRWAVLAVLAVAIGALMTYGPAVIGVLLLGGFGFTAIGRLVFRIQLETIEDGLLALVLGFGLTGVAIGYTAQFRIHFDFMYAGAHLLAIFLARRDLLTWVRSIRDRLVTPDETPAPQRISRNICIAVLLLMVIALMLFASSREAGYDAMVTHFYLSEVLRTTGEFNYDINLQRFVLMPKTAIWGLASFDVIGGEFAERAANATALAVASALIAMRASRKMGVAAASLMAATLLSAPVVLWVSAHLFEEAATLMLIAGVAVFFLRGLEDRLPMRQDIAALACLGMAVSSKAQVLFLGLMGVAIVLRRLWIDRNLRGLGAVAIGCAVFAVTAEEIGQ